MAGRIPKVIVIGPAYVDMAIKCDDFPMPGQTVDGAGFSCIPTGAGVLQALQAKLCNCDVHLLGKVGDDCFGHMACENLNAHGVNIDFLYRAQAISTGIIVTMVDSSGENSSCISNGANRALGADEVACVAAEQLIVSADLCLMHADLPQNAIVTAIRICLLHNTKSILSIPMQLHNSADLDELDWPMEYYDVDVLIPNFQNCQTPVPELGAGTTHKLKFLGSELVAKGIKCVVIHIPMRGTVLIERDGSKHIDGFDLKLVNDTATQDAFAGALAASCGTGDPPLEAARFATAAAAIAQTKFGSQDALPTKEEIIELLQNHPD